jgi:hypothetical protein
VDETEILETSTHEFPNNKSTNCAGEFVVLSTVIACENKQLEYRKANIKNIFFKIYLGFKIIKINITKKDKLSLIKSKKV